MSTVRPEHWGDICGLTEDEIEGQRVSEGIEIKVKKNPMLPSEKQVEEHYASNHVPYRSWCKVCVLGKGVNSAHFRTDKEEEQAVSTVSIDYAFITHDDVREIGRAHV